MGIVVGLGAIFANCTTGLILITLVLPAPSSLLNDLGADGISIAVKFASKFVNLVYSFAAIFS